VWQVEHHIGRVMALADKIVVLNFGGSPAPSRR
jgi:ABC-type branched-subunit amino acid transport system ATPase component